MPFKFLRWKAGFELPGGFCRTQFFPEMPDLKTMEKKGATLCVGTKTRTLGDALILSTLPGKLKALYPGLKITTYPRGMNPFVMKNNPAVEGIQRLPRALYGDDCDCGSGHLIQLKERYFGLPVSEHPKPKLFIEPTLKLEGEAYVRSKRHSGKPLILLQPKGGTWPEVSSQAFWEALVGEWKSKVEFWQVGLDGHAVVPGVAQKLFSIPNPRLLFSMISQFDAFVGVNSGPMHLARAFDLPALILTHQGSIQEIFKARAEQQPYFFNNNQIGGFLYEENTHLEADLKGQPELLELSGLFLRQILRSSDGVMPSRSGSEDLSGI